jgi:cytochrome c-type biogenesis protein CcmH/NrfG
MQSQKRRSRSRLASERGLEVPAAPASAVAEHRTYDLRRPLALAAAIIAATLLVYAQAWRFGFVLIDDPTYVSENPHVRGGLTLANIAWSFTTFHDGNWIPFTWLSLMLDTSLFGLQATGYHSTNVVLHVANTTLLFWFLVRATGNQLRSACVAALFALHPLHVESVAWITERKDVLSTLFVLLALSTYVSYVKRRGAWKFAACLVCFAASLLSKQTLVTLPFVLLLLDFWPLGRFAEQSSRARVLLEKSPFLAISAAFSAITIVAQQSGHNVASLTDFPLRTRCLNALVVYAEYFLKTFFPYHLAVFYPYPGERYFWAAVGGAALLLAAISTAALVCVRRYPFLFVGWAWFLGTLVPMIGIVQVGRQQMADRYTYFPLIGLFLAVVWLCAELVPNSALRARTLATAAVVVLAALAVAAFVQAGYWHDSVSLFRHALGCDENNPVAASALGSTLGAEGQATEGLALLELAVKLAPKDAESRFNLAVGLEKLGRIDAAIEQYQAALALDDWDARSHNNLGLLLWKRHDYQQAKQHFLRAIEIDQDHVSTYENLGALCGEMGDFAGSITYNERALQLDPTLLICHYNIGLALRAQGRLDEAIGQFRYLLSVSPGDADARRELDRTQAMPHGAGGGP